MRQKKNNVQNEYKSATKEYKNSVRKSKRNFSHQLSNKLRNIQSSNAKLFRHLLNGSTRENGKCPRCSEIIKMFSSIGKSCGGNTSSDQEVPNFSGDIDQGIKY